MVDRVGAYRDAGAEWLILAMRAPFDVDGLDRFAAEVLPAARVTAPDGVTGHELRLDPLTREWVAIVAARQDRPNLAPDGDATGAVPVLRRRARGARAVHGARVREPLAAVRARRADRRSTRALADADRLRRRCPRAARPRSSSTPPTTPARSRRSASTARAAVVDLWAERTAALLARPEIEYVLVFENRGALVGATIPHPHGQIYGFPFVPPVPRREAEVAAEHGCPLCAAVRDERRRRHAGRARRRRLGHVRARSPPAYPFGVLVAPDDARRRTSPTLDDAVTRRARRRARRHRRPLRPAASTASCRTSCGCTPACTCTCTSRRRCGAPDAQRYVASGEVGSGDARQPGRARSRGRGRCRDA